MSRPEERTVVVAFTPEEAEQMFGHFMAVKWERFDAYNAAAKEDMAKLETLRAILAQKDLAHDFQERFDQAITALKKKKAEAKG